MKRVAQSRELIELKGHGAAVRGTLHRAHNDASDRGSNDRAQGQVGIVFLNSMSSTRAAFGDSAVHLADALAECGYPVFRLDLPGFGDSDGDLPADLLDVVNRGGLASIASAKITELTSQFQLKGVILQGHCAGAVSAIYASRACKECCGLILMAPYFHLPQVVRSTARRQLSLWAVKSKLGGRLSKVFDLMKAFRLRLRTGKLPENANKGLLGYWKEVASTGLPILIVVPPDRKSTGLKPRLGEFDYIAHIVELAGKRGRITIDAADGADHSFSNRSGRAAVRKVTERWLNRTFPQQPAQAAQSEISPLSA